MQDLLTRLLLAGGGGFSPSALFGGGAVQGAWYDPGDFGATGTGGVGTLFQDDAGTTPVTAVEQPVGLMLDKSKGLVLGSELFVNPNCTDLTGFTAGGAFPPTLVFDNGVKATVTTDDAASRIQTTTITGLVVGKTYLVTVAVNNACAKGGFVASAWTWATIADTNFALGVSTRTFRVTATATSGVCRYYLGNQLDNDGNVATITQHSIKELPGNHAYQTTSASRPTLRARYNLLTRSEEFSNAAYNNSSGVTFTGSVAAFSSTAFRYQNVTGVPNLNGTTYTARVRLSSPTGKATILFRMANGSSGADSVSQLINLTASPTVYTITRTFTASGSSIDVGLDNRAAVGGDGIAGDVVATEFQLVPTAVFPTNTYQRIGAATDYATGAAFPPYLAFDGVDDSMLTNSVDFSGTDKMLVVAGVTKQSDAAIALLVELSPNLNTSNGSFYVAAPPGATPTYDMFSKGTIDINARASGFAAPITNVVTGLANIGAPSVNIRVNGVQAATSSASQGTGNYGNYPLFIGRRNNATFPLNGNLYSLIIAGQSYAAGQITSTEQWVAARTPLGSI